MTAGAAGWESCCTPGTPLAPQELTGTSPAHGPAVRQSSWLERGIHQPASRARRSQGLGCGGLHALPSAPAPLGSACIAPGRAKYLLPL